MEGEAYEERYSSDGEPYGFALKLRVFVAFGVTALAVSRNGHPALGAIFTAVVDALPFDGLPGSMVHPQPGCEQIGRLMTLPP
jgi:hypothetical protein